MENNDTLLNTANAQVIREFDLVSDLKKQLSQYQDLESRFKVITDTAPVLVWMSDTDKLCSYFNNGWLQFTGRTLDQERGNGWAEGVHPDDFNRCLDIYVTSFDQRVPFTMEYRLKRHDGQYRWILDNGVPRYSPEGEFLGYIGSCIDIHNQKTVNQQLEIHNAKLCRKNSELRGFNYIATHDLQEPLRRLTNYANLLTMSFSESISPIVNGYLHKIKDEVANMHTQINSLLEYTLLAEDKNWQEKTDLNALFNTSLEDFKNEIVEKNITVHSGNLPTLRVVPAHIKKVFANLISNAIRFARPGVEPAITVNAVKISSGSKINKYLRDEAYWEINFADNGIGFDDKYRDLVFELFQHAGNSQNCGAGVGLSIVKKIMHNHDGEVLATSRPGVGSTFRLYLPE
jgi:two-component system CheB/CheR fusion protein